MGKLISILTNRILITLFLIAVQVTVITLLLVNLSNYSFFIALILQLTSFFLLLFILRYPISASSKVTWAVLIILFPLVAILLVLMIVKGARKPRKSLGIYEEPDYLELYFPDHGKIKEKLKSEKLLLSKSYYLESMTHLPLREQTTTTYFPLGETFFESLKKDLAQAKHFIF